MKATVIKSCSIDGIPAKAGDAVEVDENTFTNLVRKGFLTAEIITQAEKESPKSKAPKS